MAVRNLELKSIEITRFTESEKTDGPRYDGRAIFSVSGSAANLDIAIDFQNAVTLEAGLNDAYRRLANWAGSIAEEATALSNRQSLSTSR